jgi:hypothetical protein
MHWNFKDYEAILIGANDRVVGSIKSTDQDGSWVFGFWYGYDGNGERVGNSSNDPFMLMKYIEQVGQTFP